MLVNGPTRSQTSHPVQGRCQAAIGSDQQPEVVATHPGPVQRLISNTDLICIRDLDSMSLAPDGRHFAIFVRQANLEHNDYRTAWLAGSTSGGRLIYLGEGGDARLRTLADGMRIGDFIEPVSRWSPDGQWLAYVVARNGEVQLWRSKADGSAQQELTHNVADVTEFRWSTDGSYLYFTVGEPREALERRDEAERRNGIRVEELLRFSDVIGDQGIPRPPAPGASLWLVASDGAWERKASEAESKIYRSAAAATEASGAVEDNKSVAFNVVGPAVVRTDGAIVQRVRVNPGAEGSLPLLVIEASLPFDNGRPIRCRAVECSNQFIKGLWWIGDDVIFWSGEGVRQYQDSFYRWSPRTGRVVSILRSEDDRFNACDLGKDFLICLRESQTRPRQVVGIALLSGRIKVIADVNPEFADLRLGRVDPIEWELPKDVANLGFPAKAGGYIIYPPDFNKDQKYPVFIAPYVAGGFPRGDAGDEQPLLSYAANGIIVVNSQFPWPLRSRDTETSATGWKTEYSAELGFPLMTMLMDSTFRALDISEARGVVDTARVGIGGVSTGAGIPLFMLQRHDRLTALSVASSGWSQYEYYGATKRFRAELLQERGDDGMVESASFWSQIDLADHVSDIRAPILFHFPDREFIPSARLLRHLDDAHMPYDAYVFPNEYHFKWQPAHRYAIYNRNLDWFRFWLQGVEDSDPGKADQYRRWEELCDLQRRKNPQKPAFCVGTKR